MKRVGAVAALAATMALIAQPGLAARKHAAGGCTAGAAEAEAAIRYITDLMVASSACKNTTYQEFALRNRTAIIAYQNTMIAHLRSKAAFDRWDTSLANQASMREATVPPAQFCQQSEPLMKHASALDVPGFRAYAAAQAASTQPTKCER